VMVAPTILDSAEENLGDPMDIKVDIIHVGIKSLLEVTAAKLVLLV
ncbi:hypothetical protein Tco_0615958, partial [Tanacetum coccineum]